MSFHKTIYLWRDIITLGIAMIVSLVFIFSNQGTTIGGLQVATLYIIGKLNGPVMRIKTIMSAKEENEKLRRQNAYLQIENSRLRDAYLENIRLRNLIKMEERDSLQCLPVKVIGRGGIGAVSSIILNAGSEDSIRVNMPIISASGLVGKVYRVGSKSSLGQILLDRNFRVSARVQRSRIEGIVKYESGEWCIFSEVPLRSDVQVGDVITTSGYSAIFPPEIRIGVVAQVDEKSYGLLKSVFIKPGVDFSRLEEVLVVTNYPQEREFGVE